MIFDTRKGFFLKQVQYISQWIDGSSYAYRHHKILHHNHETDLSVQTQLFDVNGNFINSMDVVDNSSILIANAESNQYNWSCYSALSNLVSTGEWVPVCTSSCLHDQT